MLTQEAPAREVRNIEYSRAGGRALQMDAYVPEGPGPFPAAIIVHGGGWVAGDRRWNVEPLFRPLLEAAFACFSISYRLATDPSLFGVAIDDVAEAIRYVRAHAPEFNVDPAKIVLLGESAGGHLASMAALREPGSTLKAVVALYSPADLEPLARAAKALPAPFRLAMQGMPWAGLLLTRLQELSPLRHVRSGMPPFLLIHGTADSLVPFEQSEKMCRAIRNAGAACDLIAVKGGGHGLRWWESSGLTSYKNLMTGWLRKRLDLAADLA
jgi:acetyl esterase